MKPTEDFWDAAGKALVIFALLFGMGACGAMWNLGSGTANADTTRSSVTDPGRAT